MKRALWMLRRHASAWALWMGLALVLGSLALQWGAIRPLQAQLEALENATSGKRESHIAGAGQALERPTGPRAQLAAFYGYFDRGDKLTDLLATLHVVGRGAGLEIKRAEYRMSSSPERKLDRYQVLLPIRGSYQAIRAFIATALHELPTLSLDQVQFQRKEVGEPTIDAQVSFSFHLSRHEAPAPATVTPASVQPQAAEGAIGR